ncbi:Lrp/AsnC family transcriptional regulator [Archaeoglobus profundus]|uniref:Transcriptional regulator, AsnC family n=1 Tax=Archaeoglobus profundus (strain DSM 5631 / JCM 9629 / NBRC 100127 / Av18) TaxID=572546 RepID=D2RI65_ARCPA|nr:Lrp/AsnC family transcriptional regulator [Archaeoglobus profundus]ADB57990.1 transcriptional regulator, AsnC family [Archaeoglobus profundus DSM 5631]
MPDKIDRLDIEILIELQKDARKSLKEIAEKLDVAEGTVYNRINKLKRMGVIEKFIPIINHSKLGFDLTAIIGITAEGKHLVELENILAKEPNVTAVYDVTGEFDVITVAKFKTREDLNEFVKRIAGMKHVKKTYTMLVLNVVKENHAVELEKLIDKILE